jgi:Mg-chelatase subunit ChlD
MTQKCQGNVSCADKQDLLFVVDGSASLSPDEFKAVKGFVTSLAKMYKPPTRMGVVQFGNGKLLDNDIVSGALKVSDFSSALGQVGAAIGSLALLNGFPNMAQALAIASDMFKQTPQDSAKAMIVITNSKPLYKFQTFEKAARLREDGVRIFVVAVSDFLQAGPLWDKAEDLDIVKKIASQPTDANFVHIPALQGPGANPQSFVPTVLGRSCQAAVAL